MIKSYQKKYTWVSVTIIILGIMFIFFIGHQSISESSLLSKYMAVLTDKLIVQVTGHHERSLHELELIIRKLAHFIEYFLFGTFLYIATNIWSRNKCIQCLIYISIGLFIPFIEEWIQKSASGRGSDFFDVMIDMAGLAGAFIIGSIYSIFDKIKSEAKKE